jgi:hypothetical protein
MKKLLSAVLVGMAVIGVFVVPVMAHIGGAINEADPTVTDIPLNYESISYFKSYIKVNTDNSIDVIEEITYNTGPASHHGIYRDIYPFSSQNRSMSIEDISVSDKNGETGGPYQYTVSNSGKYKRIKIGDPNNTFVGQKTYVIRYRATNAVAQYQEGDHDEIYWNVTGNQWGFPILYAEATVSLPQGVQSKQSSCYYGREGSKTQCEVDAGIIGSAANIAFKSPGQLRPGEQMTVATGFDKGVVIPYSASDNASNFFARYWKLMLAILLPLLTFIFSYRNWYAKGRDDRPTSTIIPQYDVPADINPMEAVGILKERVTAESISAEIVYLATQGYLKIVQTENKILGLIKTTDYELHRLPKPDAGLDESDRMLLDALFGGGDSVALSDLKNVFYQDIPRITKSVTRSLVSTGYYKNLGASSSSIGAGVFTKSGRSGLIRLVFGVLIFIAYSFGVMNSINSLFSDRNAVILGIGFVVSLIIYFIFSYLSPAKTDKGVTAKEHLLGLKEYLQIAEKDRLQFHNAPEKKPEVFERLLPYAMALGVATIWAKEFEGIYTSAPSWYSGPAGTNFNALILANSLSNFSTAAASSLTSSPRSSGSGGGGFSGGGGGGGGGGSW